MTPRELLLNVRFRIGRTLRRPTWPTLAAMGCLLAAGVASATSSWLSRDAHEAFRRVGLYDAEMKRPSAPPMQTAADRLNMIVPIGEQRLDDVRDVFQLAERFDVHISAAQYEETQDGLQAPFLVRRVAFRATDEYAEIKTLLQAVLENAPHAYLAALTMERGDIHSSRVNASFTIAWVYQGGRRRAGTSLQPPASSVVEASAP